MKKIFFALFLLGFGAAGSTLRADEFQEIIVSPGDTLWSISQKYLKDPQKWPEIVRSNNLSTSDPTVTLPGTRLRVPMLLIKEQFRNALLVSAIPEVRYKRRDETEWHEAKENMTLKYEDSLRTMEGGQARVKFPSKELVQINENSYIVLKPEKILQEIQLLQGDIRASHAKVIMPQGTVIQPKGASADYRARVRQDKTEVVFVYKGKVDVTAQGKTVTVPEGFGTSVAISAPPLEPMPLSKFKDFNPADLTPIEAPTIKRINEIEVAKGVLEVHPPTQGGQDSSSGKSRSVVANNLLVKYRLQIASDEEFQKIVLDKTQSMGTTLDIKSQPIPDGNYFMRVAFIDALGSMGNYSHPSTVIKDTVPPKFTDLVPDEGHVFKGEESYCDVVGTVEGAALVAVNDEVLFISQTGRFNKFLTLAEGQNTIKISARDSQGNETIINRHVYYRAH